MKCEELREPEKSRVVNANSLPLFLPLLQGKICQDMPRYAKLGCKIRNLKMLENTGK